MLHHFFASWMQFVLDYGYLGVFVMMILESTAFPIPAEVVIPPAAFWAAQGRLNIWLVVVAATAGSWIGSAASYWIAWKVGRPIIIKYGRYAHLSQQRLEKADAWFDAYGGGGIFVARLLPGIRHLISIPAGLFKMNFGTFSLMTILGAGLFCAALAWFGIQVIGDQPRLMQDPRAMTDALASRKLWFILFALAVAMLYGVMTWMQRRAKSKTSETRPS